MIPGPRGGPTPRTALPDGGRDGVEVRPCAIGRGLFARRAFAPGKEITFDYSTTMEEEFWTLECRCGAPTCRGRVTDFRDLPDPLRRRYLDLGVVQGFIALRERRLAGRRKEGAA